MYRLHVFIFFQRHAPVTSTCLAFHDLKFLSSRKGLTSQWLSSSSCSDIPITFTSQSQLAVLQYVLLSLLKMTQFLNFQVDFEPSIVFLSLEFYLV